MALTQGLLNQYWRRFNQRRALTGLPTSYQEQRGMLDPIMEAVSNKDVQEARIRSDNEFRDRQMTLQEKAQRDADRASAISGVTGLLNTGVSGYLGYKSLTKPPTALENAATNYYNKLATNGGTPSPSVPVNPGVGSGGVPPTTGAGSALTPPGNTGYQAPVIDTATTLAPEGPSVGPSTPSITDVGAGLAAGLISNYVMTQTGEGKKSNAAINKVRPYLGLTSLSDNELAQKGSATAGGAVASGGWGAAIGAAGFDVVRAATTGKISNELLGMPFADKLINTDLSSIFGW